MTATGTMARTESLNVTEAVSVLASRWRLLLLVVAIVAASAYAGSFLISPRYRATAKLVIVQGGDGNALARFGNLAGALGMDVGQSQNPLNLYAEYLLSRDLLADVARTPLPLSSGGEITILEAWGGDTGSEAERMHQAIERLEDHFQVRRREDAGVLEITVESPDPVASSHLANDFAHRLNEFDAELKRWSGRNRGDFLRARRIEIMGDVRAAEDSLTSFRMANRVLTHPRLRQEEMRLLREVAIQSELLQTVRVQEELANLEAKTESPVLKTLQHAVPPVERSWPRRGRIVVVASVVAAILLVYFLLAQHQLKRSRPGDPQAA